MSYSSGLPLWPLAAQNKIWFLKSNASACYFSSLTLRWRTWRCLTDILDPRILREVSALPEHITKVWEVRNTIHHSLIHPSIIHPSSIHPSIHPFSHSSFHSFHFIHLSILWSLLILISSFTQYWSNLSVFLELFKSEYMVGLEGNFPTKFPTKLPLNWYLKDT